MYRIGQAAALAGMNTETLRAWERRYTAVEPDRDASNLRVYSEQDVERLRIMQKLIEAGARIGDIARLSEPELAARLAQLPLRELSDRPLPLMDAQAVPVFVVDHGGISPADLSDHGFNVVGQAGELVVEAGVGLDPAVTLLIWEESITSQRKSLILQVAEASGASMVLVLYRFVSRDILQQLRDRGLITMRMTSDIGEIKHALLARHYWQEAELSRQGELTEFASPRPRFSAEQLARAESLAPALQCECPRHMSDLIQSLIAFEQYSQSCAINTEQDAKVHGMLAAATGRARHTLEDALIKLLEAENAVDLVFSGQAAKGSA